MSLNANKIAELTREKSELANKAQLMLQQAAEDHGGLTDEESETFNAMHDDVEKLTAEISELDMADKRHEAAAERQVLANERLNAVRLDSGIDKLRRLGTGVPASREDVLGRPATLEAYDDAIQGWYLSAKAPGSVTEKHRRAIEATGCYTDSEGQLHIPLSDRPMYAWKGGQLVNAQSTTATEGGDTIAEGFVANLERALLEFGGVRQVAQIRRTSTGSDLPWPTVDDTSQSGSLLSENTQDSEQDVTTGVLTLNAYKYTSKIVRVSTELMQDSAFNFGAEIGTLLGERLARIQNTHATTGTGSSQPNGCVTASTAGKTAASATAITYSELLDLKHSVDPAYRMNNQSRWMFNDSTLKALKQLVDGDSRPLWVVSPRVGEPDALDGDGYTINQDMASITNSAKTVLYGAFNKYILREVRDITLVRMNERYADYHQTGFVAFMRFDADLLDAGTNPLKHLIQLA